MEVYGVKKTHFSITRVYKIRCIYEIDHVDPDIVIIIVQYHTI
jgi:hypothetical protein